MQLLEADQNLAPSAHKARSTIARIIANGGVVTRRDIVAVTGLARSTIHGHLKVLLEAGLIEDAGESSVPQRGRPAQAFRIKTDRGVVLVADIAIDHCRLAITSLDKKMLGRRTVEVSVDCGPDVCADVIAVAFEELLAELGIPPERALAISVGIPGPVDSHKGVVVRPPLMPGWDGFEACNFMASRFGCDAIVDNEVHLRALAEARLLSEEDLPLLLVNVESGVGGGFVSENGLLLQGADGAAADIGHIQVRGGSDALCACGNRGCLSAVASLGAMAARVAAVSGHPVTPHDLIDRLVRGDATAVSIVREVGATLGSAVADLVNFCNPARIVVSGQVTLCTDDMLAQIRSVVSQQAQPLATRNLRIMSTVLGDEAGLIGGMISGIEQVLSPRGIQYHTRPADSDMKPLGLQ